MRLLALEPISNEKRSKTPKCRTGKGKSREAGAPRRLSRPRRPVQVQGGPEESREGSASTKKGPRPKWQKKLQLKSQEMYRRSACKVQAEGGYSAVTPYD